MCRIKVDYLFPVWISLSYFLVSVQYTKKLQSWIMDESLISDCHHGQHFLDIVHCYEITKACAIISARKRIGSFHCVSNKEKENTNIRGGTNCRIRNSH